MEEGAAIVIPGGRRRRGRSGSPRGMRNCEEFSLLKTSSSLSRNDLRPVAYLRVEA